MRPHMSKYLPLILLLAACGAADGAQAFPPTTRETACGPASPGETRRLRVEGAALSRPSWS